MTYILQFCRISYKLAVFKTFYCFRVVIKCNAMLCGLLHILQNGIMIVCIYYCCTHYTKERHIYIIISYYILL